VRADVVLGFDPTPSDPNAVTVVRDALRRTVRALVEGRSQLDRLGRTGSVWDGPVGAPIATLLRHYSRQLSALEESVIDCLQAVEAWSDRTQTRQEQVDQLVEGVADLAGDPSAEDRRTRLIATARELGVEHDRAAADLVAAFEELSSAVEQIAAADDDLAGDLDRALLALTAAVDDWIAAEAPELLRTAIALGEVAGLTTVISELVGIAALGRNPGEAEGVGEIIARSPGSHRLIRALRQQWLEVAPVTLPEATFAVRRSVDLADALAGRRTRSIDADAGTGTSGGGGSTGSGE
jgi:ABC-type transporter Mla subunit MlaD